MRKKSSPPVKEAVAYYRVSTKGQGKSGLGLEDQRNNVRHFCEVNNMKIVKEFIGIESAKKLHRKSIEDAIQYCRQNGATLLIATLDRLARNVLFVALLIESKTPFISIDKPYADKFTTLRDATNAEEESDKISKRTKAALKVAKSHGVKLGKFGKVLAKRNKERADKFILRLTPIILKLQRKGFKTARSLANELNRLKVRTYRIGGTWHIGTIYNLLHRL